MPNSEVSFPPEPGLPSKSTSPPVSFANQGPSPTPLPDDPSSPVPAPSYANESTHTVTANTSAIPPCTSSTIAIAIAQSVDARYSVFAEIHGNMNNNYYYSSNCTCSSIVDPKGI